MHDSGFKHSLFFSVFKKYMNYFISHLEKSCKNSPKNSHIFFTQVPQLLIFNHISFTIPPTRLYVCMCLCIFVCVCHIFSEPSENKIHTWYPITLKCFSVNFLKTRTFLHDHIAAIKIRKLTLIQNYPT